VLGADYDLFMIAYPHFWTLQGKVAREVARISGARVSVLEIGCGPGPTSAAVLEADPRMSLACVENERVMVDQATEYLSPYIQAGRVRLIHADALEYLKACDSSSFDALVSGWTLHNFLVEYRQDVHNEIYRILRPGGLFINGDKYACDDAAKHALSLEWSLNRFYEVYTPAGHIALRDGWIIHMIEDNQPGVIMYEGAATTDLKRVGFSEVRTVWREQMEAVIIAQKLS